MVRQGNILHHGKVQAGINAEVGSNFRIARCSFGFLVPFARQQVHHFRRGFHGGLLDRVGSLPVAAGQVDACTIDPVVQVGIRKLVGNDSAVLAGAVLVIVKALLEAVGLGSSALGSHTVGCGVTFGGQNIVQCIMGIFANGQVVIAIGQDIAACAVMGGGIIAGQQVLVHRDGDCFGSTGGQFLRFAEACQLDGGFLNAVLALVIAVRGLCVQLHNGLTGHIAGVRHGNFRGDLVIAHIHAVQLLVKRGVGQAITEGVLHFIGVIPGRSAFQCANRSGGVALAHNGIGVTGLIVTVANVDAFGLEGHVLSVLILTDRGVDLVHVGKLRGTGAGVYSGRGGEGIGRVSIGQMAGGVDRTFQDLSHARKALMARVTDEQDGVGVGDDVLHLHLVGAVQQDNDLVKVLADHFQQVALVLVQGQTADGGAVSVDVVHQNVLTFGALACEHDDGGIFVIIGPGVG